MKNSFYKLLRKFTKIPDPNPKNCIVGDHSEILLTDLEKRLGTLDCFRFLDCATIRDLIQKNYRHVNTETLDFAVSKIMMRNLGDQFRTFKTEEERCNFTKTILNYYMEHNINVAKLFMDYLILDKE